MYRVNPLSGEVRGASRMRLGLTPRVSSLCECEPYARRMGQPTQRATNYTARSNIDTAQIFLHANGQRLKRAMIRQRSRRRQRRGEPHTEHGLGVLLAYSRFSRCTTVSGEGLRVTG